MFQIDGPDFVSLLHKAHIARLPHSWLFIFNVPTRRTWTCDFTHKGMLSTLRDNQVWLIGICMKVNESRLVSPHKAQIVQLYKNLHAECHADYTLLMRHSFCSLHLDTVTWQSRETSVPSTSFTSYLNFCLSSCSVMVLHHLGWLVCFLIRYFTWL